MFGWKPKAGCAWALFPLLGISACTVAPPTGPTIVAFPGPGKNFPQFQRDDAMCQSYAQTRMSASGQQAAAAGENANRTAVVGTLLGAAAGAALGAIGGNAGLGAAAGSGAGLLGGSSVAGSQAQSAADSMQAQYNAFYAQCMVGNGEALQPPAPAGYAAPPPISYGY